MVLPLMKPVVLLLGISVLASPLLAQTGLGQGQSATSAAEEDEIPEIVVEGERDPKDKKVCRVEVRIGSTLPKRVCRTVREEEELSKASAEGLQQARDRMDAQEFTRMKERDGQPNS